MQEDTIVVVGHVPKAERSPLLEPLILQSTSAAAARGQSLVLIRPKKVRFSAKEKSADEIELEREAYREAARQFSLLDKELSELQPCKYSFKFDYLDDEGKEHSSTCDDWETSAMYRKFSKTYGDQYTLQHMRRTFEEDYPAKGMAFALGTHSRFPDTWLLVGVVRLDIQDQTSLGL